MSDLDAAGRAGARPATLAAERAAIMQAVGCYGEAHLLLREAAPRRSDFAMLSALAVLHAESGNIAEAVHVFQEARNAYRGVSPFPLAQLDFRRGLMWHSEGELRAAREAFEAARRRVPGYAPAIGHLAEVELLCAEADVAADRLRPLAETSDEPVGVGNALPPTAPPSAEVADESSTPPKPAAATPRVSSPRRSTARTTRRSGVRHTASTVLGWAGKGGGPVSGRPCGVARKGGLALPRCARVSRGGAAHGGRGGPRRRAAGVPVLVSRAARGGGGGP
ncbi:hypothetical protein ACFWIJ_23100, partial [Streptomyces sp. NPDC127079]